MILWGFLKISKAAVREVSKVVENTKTEHEMANETISSRIKGLPPSFNMLFDVIWSILEKQDNSDQKILEILEEIANASEAKFILICASVKRLFESNASKNDLKEVGEKIISSDRDQILEILDRKLVEISNLDMQQTSYDDLLDSFRLSLCNYELPKNNY